MHPLDPAVKSVWMIKSALVWGILLLGSGTMDLARLLVGEGWFPAGVLTGTILLVGTLWTVLIPRLRYRFWRYELRTEELELIRGIWRRVITIVPLKRIQHLDVSQDIIERNFELGRLVVHTAGTRSSDVIVPGLQYTEATRLRDEVRQFITGEAV